MGYFKGMTVPIDRETIFTAMNIRPTTDNYDVYVKAYDELEETLPEILNTQAIYRLVENRPELMLHQDLKSVSHLVCCMVTLGEGISQQCTEYFLKKDYLKGLMIDKIADQLLFDLSNKFYNFIRETVSEKQGYGLTKRYSPDDYQIPIQYQKNILEIVDGYYQMGVHITEGYMYNPIKTLGYVYGADKFICTAEKDHDCTLCSNTTCTFRKQA